MAVRERKRLGDLLVEAGAINEDQLKRALDFQRKSGKKLGEAITELKILTEEQIVDTLATQLGIPFVNLDDVQPNLDLMKKVPENVARKYSLFPWKKEGNVVTIIMSDPLNLFAIDEVAIKTGCEVEVTISMENMIQSAISKHYGVTSSIQDALRSLRGVDIQDTTEEEARLADVGAVPTEMAPVAKLVDTLVRQAVYDRASDIHIEPDEENMKIRCRVDGVMFIVATAPKRLQNALISRVKVISNMDIAETRIPQDGRFKIRMESGMDIEFRVSSYPTIYGENVVIRILRADATMKNMEETGLVGKNLEKALKLFKAPFGIIVVTGPTGSGKTTTLYSGLNLLNTVDKNIITIEDPVEYRLAGIRQSQVNLKAGLDFATSLRSILRQDPDVIMVGEIRDVETAEIAIQAAMTGHVVLSTLHTNDAPSAVIRFIDLGVEPFLISSGLVGVVAQRLVRTICLRCKKPIPHDEAVKLIKGIKENMTIYKGEGCMQCNKTGLTGRMGIFEVLEMDDEARSLTTRRASASALKEHAVKHQGMKTMRQDGLEKVLAGKTTVDEVLRVTAEF